MRVAESPQHFADLLAMKHSMLVVVAHTGVGDWSVTETSLFVRLRDTVRPMGGAFAFVNVTIHRVRCGLRRWAVGG